MDAFNHTYTPLSQEQITHALLLQWLLNPQSSNLTRAQIQDIDWQALMHYYLHIDNEERLRIFVDYLCQNDYQQLRNHAILPLIHHRLLPMIFMIIDVSYDASMKATKAGKVSKTAAYYKKQRLLILTQLLTEQSLLMRNYFNNSPKALVNVLKAMQRWEKESVTLSIFNDIMPRLFDLTLDVYLHLPKKPAYRFATLELRAALLNWFRYVNTVVQETDTKTFAHTQFIQYFHTIAHRQHLLELIENRQLHELMPQNEESFYSHGIPQPEADEACISRAGSGLMRLWS